IPVPAPVDTDHITVPMSSSSSSARLSGGSARSRRYRTRAVTSQVDETLFGTPQVTGGSDRVGRVRSSAVKRRDTVRVISHDMIRDLNVPCKDPSGLSIILCASEIERITAESLFPTKEEKERQLEAQQSEKEAIRDAAEQRKARMRQADLSRNKNQTLSELEAEAKERAQYLLERANLMRMEQEDEVKKLNELILGAQCHAVRDAQILEKEQIQTELVEEDKRLDAMMELERCRAVESHDQIEQLRKQQRIQGKTYILKQIEEHNEARHVEEELREQEGQQMLENLERMQEEELQALDQKREEQRRLQLEILRINEESLLSKERMKEDERLADVRAVAYTRKKMEQEAEYEAELQRIKKEKEKEVARLRALQERERDHKAEQDEIRARRNQEATDREWRKKEKERHKKKVEEEGKLKVSRLEQVTHKEHLLAIEAGRERAEFERVIRVQQEAITREKELEENHRQRLLRHAEGVRQQMRARELQAIAQRKELFHEGNSLLEEAHNRRIRLNEIKAKKLRELKAAGLPEKYCSYVERKVPI
uniref:Cilia- and flagella-associated protein 45 n=1 Tax=Denticeps clupeoides TaxID=299321 RepID=A0AAY4C842_9TELE